ncbi:MAG: hypothetical protein V6Z86_08100 [Hyphomicrobiales bacterium]
MSGDASKVGTPYTYHDFRAAFEEHQQWLAARYEKQQPTDEAIPTRQGQGAAVG